MYNFIKLFWLLLLVLISCKPIEKKGNSNSYLSGGRISIEGRRFVDSSGRHVILNGINYVNKNPSDNYIFTDSAAIFEQFKKWGFNCIRLGIIWDGVEPEPGKFDEAYLDKVEEQVIKAKQQGLYVLLDMHQDLFSVLYSDGAPRWATLTDGQQHVTGSVWSDSYFLSPAVQKAFDNFWANKPAPDGVGIQDHYARMWKHIAERFSGYSNVIGYDLMNEPFNGTPGTLILPVILKEYATLYARETGNVYSEEQLMEIWADEEKRMKALDWMSDVERYSKVISAATGLSQKFEKNELKSMYQRVADQIREVDSTHLLFLEHAYFSNAGVQSGIEPVLTKTGEKDRLVAYAAHGYDLLVDTKSYGKSNIARVEYIFDQVNKVSERIDRPVIIGEWGAFSGSTEEIVKLAQTTRSIFDEYNFSHTYWAYYRGIENNPYFFKTFSRPSVQFINGRLDSLKFNYETGEFACSWKESAILKQGTVIFVPDITQIKKDNISILPAQKEFILKQMDNSKGGYIIIPVSGEDSESSISFKMPD